MYKLSEWVNPNLLNWTNLNKNPKAISLLEQNKDKINWEILSSNLEGSLILEKYPDKISWSKYSRVGNSYKIFKDDFDKIHWDKLSMNDSNVAIEILKQNINKIDWNKLSLNKKCMEIYEYYPEKIFYDDIFLSDCEEPLLLQLILENKETIFEYYNWYSFSYSCRFELLLEIYYDKIIWSYLSLNDSNAALKLLELNQDKINWNELCFNKHDRAVKLLIDNPDKINWENLSSNPNPLVIELLKTNQDKINWDNLSYNPIIFEINYDFLKHRLDSTFKEELIATILHPSNYHKFKYYDL